MSRTVTVRLDTETDEDKAKIIVAIRDTEVTLHYPLTKDGEKDLTYILDNMDNIMVTAIRQAQEK